MKQDDGTAGRLERFGLKGTKVYLIILFGGIPIGAYFGFIDLDQLKLNELGDFLAGAFGPLAIFWLVLGFFQQGKELRHSVEALKLQAEELRNSVEQQKEMVGITKEQLQLDVEVREEQTKVAVARELPFFQLRGGGSGSNGGVRRYRFFAKNVGAPSLNATLSLTENDDVLLQQSGFPYIDKNQEMEFAIVSHQGKSLDPKKEYSLTLSSTNIREQTRKQVFTIKNGIPVLTSTDPENR